MKLTVFFFLGDDDLIKLLAAWGIENIIYQIYSNYILQCIIFVIPEQKLCAESKGIFGVFE